MVGVAQLVRASGCGPGGRGFKSLHSPHFFWASVAQLDRAPDFGSGGRGFESFRARKFFYLMPKFVDEFPVLIGFLRAP